MKDLKETILGAAIFGGLTIFRLLIVFIGIFPLFLLPIPWWLSLIIFFIIIYSTLLGDIVHAIVYFFALPNVLNYSSLIVVLFFISLVISAINWINDFRVIISNKNNH